MDDRNPWQELRALRAEPPGLAAKDVDRRAVLSASLQQAQELADATAASGYATKALPLFYCFSQGLRAIAAARIDSSAWQIRGHGARVSTASPILDTSVIPRPTARTEAQDALSALHTIVGAVPMSKPLRLGDVWAAFPDSPLLSKEINDAAPALRLHLPRKDLRARLIAEGRIDLAIEGLDVDLSDESLVAQLESYPSLAGGTPARDAISPETAPFYCVEGTQAVFNTSGRLLNFASFQPWAATSPVLSWLLDANTDDAFRERFEKLGPLVVANADEFRITLPALGGVDEPEFIALLWALLLALSSLVRYEPAYWKAAIDPDLPPLAVPIEQFCDFAEKFVPRVLHAMLTECE
jgi:hypothetical protein